MAAAMKPVQRSTSEDDAARKFGVYTPCFGHTSRGSRDVEAHVRITGAQLASLQALSSYQRAVPVSIGGVGNLQLAVQGKQGQESYLGSLPGTSSRLLLIVNQGAVFLRGPHQALPTVALIDERTGV